MTSTTTSICCLIPLYAHVRTFPRKFPFIQYFNKRISILLFLTYLLTSCNTMENQKYAWIASPSAPEEYPMEIYKGALISEDYAYTFDSIWGIMNPGWGNAAGMMCAANYPAHLPHLLKMTWYSYIEKKYYTGSWEVDKNEILKIIRTYLNHYPSEFEFRVGLGPEGLVSLWIYGDSQLLIGTYQAQETVLTPENTDESFEHHFRAPDRDIPSRIKAKVGDSTYQKLMDNGWHKAVRYHQYNTKFDWKLKANGLENFRISNSFFWSPNGEKILSPVLQINDLPLPKPLPTLMYISYKDKQGQKWAAQATFDYDYLYNLISSISNEEAFTFVYDIDMDNHQLKVYLEANEQKLALNTLENLIIKENMYGKR